MCQVASTKIAISYQKKFIAAESISGGCDSEGDCATVERVNSVVDKLRVIGTGSRTGAGLEHTLRASVSHELCPTKRRRGLPQPKKSGNDTAAREREVAMILYPKEKFNSVAMAWELPTVHSFYTTLIQPGPNPVQ